MEIDRQLYRQAYEAYQQWNQAELIERARNAGKLSSQDAWHQYVALWEFGMKLAIGPSDRQHRQRQIEWDEYYARVQKCEEWRRTHGKSA
jgi:hypothetical protein